MDAKFPARLFPQYYWGCSPALTRNNGVWSGSYERVLDVNSGPDAPAGSGGFEAQYNGTGEEWLPVRAAVLPLFPANQDVKLPLDGPGNPLDYVDHMKFFYQRRSADAFSTMGRLLQDQFHLQHRLIKDKVQMHWTDKFSGHLKYKRCETSWTRAERYHRLLGDVLSDVPRSLLAELLHEELTSPQHQHLGLAFTGGALAYLPLHQTASGSDGCLIYPSGEAMDKLAVHRVVPEFSDHKPPAFFMEPKPFSIYMNGPIRQISLSRVELNASLGVRSDYFCGMWILGDETKPRLLELIQAKERFSCLNASPHIAEELVTVSERGDAYLWSVRKGLQKIREADDSSDSHDQSSWRWCEFSSHPRVMLYAERSGAELLDSRMKDSRQLFQIGKTSACVAGEEVTSSKYLSEIHSHHHLICTQFSAYVLDDRAPLVPMLKWNHMMESPPLFSCSLPEQNHGGPCKVLLGSHGPQEVMLLPYSGGKERACRSRGLIQKLHSPRESLSCLKPFLPHRRRLAEKRLNVPAIGLTAMQNKNFLSVFQLTEAGDLFFQTLKLQTDQILSEPSSPRINTESREDLHTVTSEIPDPDLQAAWNHWLQPLFANAAKRKPKRLEHQQIKTQGLVELRVTKKQKKLSQSFKKLRSSLQELTRNRDLLLHRVTNLPPLTVCPVPAINPSAWPDALSQRMTVVWGGEMEDWRRLGSTEKERVAVLRKKKRREKRARSSYLAQLSGSFSASGHYDLTSSPSRPGLQASQEDVKPQISAVSSQEAPEVFTNDSSASLLKPIMPSQRLAYLETPHVPKTTFSFSQLSTSSQRASQTQMKKKSRKGF